MEGGGGVGKREGWKREAAKRGKGMYADLRNDGYGSGREEIVERKETEAGTGVKVLVCGDETGEENVFPFMHETWLTSGQGREKKCKAERRRKQE